MLTNYNEFLLEREFELITNDIFRLFENEINWTGNNTAEWNLEENQNTTVAKLQNFLSKLSKEKIREYFIKLMNKIQKLPDLIRRNLIITYTSVFLMFAGIGFLLSTPQDTTKAPIEKNIKSEIIKLNKKSDFNKAQELVKISEAGYTDDKTDKGNWLFIKGKKLLIGTNHGISAQILYKYLGKVPTKKDMKNLTYETALKIYRSKFWDNQNLTHFADQSVANIIYDGCVNQGVEGAKEVLKNALSICGVKISDDDNPFMKKWIKKANLLDQLKLFKTIKKCREDRYKSSPKKFKRFGRGWMNRLNSITYEEENTDPLDKV